MLLLYLILIVYIFAINFYSFLLIKSQKEDPDDSSQKLKAGDGKLFLAGFLGGALAIYISMFLFRFRLKNLFLMIVMPILAVINLYLFFLAFRSGIPFFFR